MKSSPLYSIAFTVLLCGLSAGVLTYANTAWQKRIAANREYDKAQAVVEALGLLAPGPHSRREVADVYDAQVSQVPHGQMTVYQGTRDAKIVGYAFGVEGQGQCGPIKGILAVDASKSRILSLKVYQQEETPGLGAQITDPRWLGQFAGKSIRTDGSAGVVVSSDETGPNVICAISGATKTSYSIASIVNCGIASFAAGGSSMVELDLDINRPDAVTRATPGYPREWVRPPHLRQEGKGRSFLVPDGLTNLARGKPVTSSDPMPVIGELSQITDGVMTCNEGDFVELGNGLHWVQIDLGEVRTIHAVAIWLYYKNPIIYNDLIVRVADDANVTRNVRVLFNNDHDNSSGLGAGKDSAFFARWWGEVIDARNDRAGTKGRYVRVQTNGSTGDKGNCYVEIGVYGK